MSSPNAGGSKDQSIGYVKLFGPHHSRAWDDISARTGFVVRMVGGVQRSLTINFDCTRPVIDETFCM